MNERCLNVKSFVDKETLDAMLGQMEIGAEDREAVIDVVQNHFEAVGGDFTVTLTYHRPERYWALRSAKVAPHIEIYFMPDNNVYVFVVAIIIEADPAKCPYPEDEANCFTCLSQVCLD